MNNRDWEQFGSDILKTVQEAIESCNYDRLNQNVGDAVNQVVDSVTKNIKNINAHSKHTETKKENQTQYDRPNYDFVSHQKKSEHELSEKLKNSDLIRKPTKTWWTILCVFGYGGAAFFTLLSLVMLLGLLIAPQISAGIWIAFGMFVMVAAIGAGMGITGSKMRSRIDRFNQYVKEIGRSEFCKISALASRVRKKESFVVKDLEKMIHKGWFLQGHLDKQNTCIIVTNQMYEQYRQLEQRSEQQKIEEEKKQKDRLQKQSADEAQCKNTEKNQMKKNQMKKNQAEYRKTLSPEVQKAVEQGEAFVRKIRECNDAIPGEEISAKIDRMEIIVDKILDRVEQNPQSVKDVRKLMDYYLPTTVKLLEAYVEMDAQPIGGENIVTAKREIEATLDTLNAAFEKILDSLFQEKAWDVSSDISVLNTMLAYEGLKEDGLKNSN